VRELADGGTYNTLAGQPTDDSEMALMLARSVARSGHYDQAEAALAYALWFASAPFDCGQTTARALGPALAMLRQGARATEVADAARAAADRASQANGALMRVSPLGIFAHAMTPSAAAHLAREDAALTHPHPICQDANAVFVVAISHAVATGSDPWETYAFTLDWATCQSTTDPAIQQCLKTAADHPPAEYLHHQGWVLIALQNAFWQLLHAPSFGAGVVDTVMHGGDTDTNAAIAGALLGAVHGIEAVPPQWRDALSSCRPERGRPLVHRPRPKPFWPVDAPQLAEALVALGQSHTGSTATG
jgi:ADP-ribosylglycohydrolase